MSTKAQQPEPPSGYLVMEHEGETETIPVTGIGGSSRVAVGQLGRRSAIWNIWANRNKSDVYVAARNIAGWQKFSLHESGDFRYAWTTQATEQFTQIESRILDRWERAQANEAGWTPALSVWVRAEDVTETPDGTTSEVEWLPEPPPGRATGFHLAFIEPRRIPVELQDVAVLDVLTLANGQGLVVFATESDLDEPTQAMLQTVRARGIEALEDLPELQPRLSKPGMRLMFFGNNDAGHRFVWDMAVTPNALDSGAQS